MTESVKNVYNAIATEFDRTRYKPWPSVVEFISSWVESQGAVVDIGCGNGKYLPIIHDMHPTCDIFACDLCEALVDIVHTKYPYVNVRHANCTQLPYKDAIMDHCISIAMFHHLSSYNDRCRCLSEMHRVLKEGGTGLITVWGTHAYTPEKYTLWRKIHSEGGHGNQGMDMLIPWKQKDGSSQERYYHLFEKHEIVSYVSRFFTILNVFEECNNWYVVFKK